MSVQAFNGTVSGAIANLFSDLMRIKKLLSEYHDLLTKWQARLDEKEIQLELQDRIDETVVPPAAQSVNPFPLPGYVDSDGYCSLLVQTDSTGKCHPLVVILPADPEKKWQTVNEYVNNTDEMDPSGRIWETVIHRVQIIELPWKGSKGRKSA
jgi:hypothetical protein